MEKKAKRPSYCALCGGEDQVNFSNATCVDGIGCAHCNEPEGDRTDQGPADLFREIMGTLWDDRHHFENIENVPPETYWVEWAPAAVGSGDGRHYYAYHKDARGNTGGPIHSRVTGKPRHYTRSHAAAACINDALPRARFTVEAVEAEDHSIYPMRKGAPSHDDCEIEPTTEDYRARCPECGDVSRYTTDLGFDPGCEHYLTADTEHFFFFGTWKGQSDD